MCLDGQDWTACVVNLRCLGFRVYAIDLSIFYKVDDVCYCKVVCKCCVYLSDEILSRPVRGKLQSVIAK